jgi:hypothetical protein
MKTQEHNQTTIDQLKQIIITAQNNLDALYADQLEYKHLETSMNYIRLCTQKAQYHFKYSTDPSCEHKPFGV